MVFICKNLSPLHPKDAQIGPEVLEKKIFIFRKCIFTISLSFPPWKGARPFICINLKFFHTGAKFG